MFTQKSISFVENMKRMSYFYNVNLPVYQAMVFVYEPYKLVKITRSRSVWKLLILDKNTWNHMTVCKLFIKERRSLNYITICKQMMIIIIK